MALQIRWEWKLLKQKKDCTYKPPQTQVLTLGTGRLDN